MLIAKCCESIRLAVPRGLWLVMACALLALGGCAGHGLVLHDHPLVGRIVEVDGGHTLAPDEALARMAAADALLLGEVHDNPAHHRLQLKVLQYVDAKRAPALAMEQFDSEHQAAIDAAQAEADASAESLADAGRFAREGWGWPLYKPLVEEAASHGLPLLAINLSRAEARRVAREGLDAMPGGKGRQIVDKPWTAQRQRQLEDAIRVGHCGQVSPEVLKMIVTAQRSRDAVMAERIAPQLGRGVVAILGAGHARRDLAVPIYLARLAPQRRVLSVGLVEVREGLYSPSDYPAVAQGLFDVVWFTPLFERPDPCERLSKAGMNKAMSK